MPFPIQQYQGQQLQFLQPQVPEIKAVYNERKIDEHLNHFQPQSTSDSVSSQSGPKTSTLLFSAVPPNAPPNQKNGCWTHHHHHHLHRQQFHFQKKHSDGHDANAQQFHNNEHHAAVN